MGYIRQMTQSAPVPALPWPGAIGICLSGGGYRAAGVHLGVLAYLDRLGILGNVRMLSAVSGATVTCASYAISLVEKQAFADYFCDVYAFIRDTRIIELSIEELVHRPPQRPSGRDNLLVAMADVYANTLFADATGEPYRFGAILDADIHLDEIVFNALEFRHADAFLFQRSVESSICVGNPRLCVPDADAAAIRVADIVASCISIPGALEPLSFPDDFAWPDQTIPTDTRVLFSDSAGNPRPVPLMDGGLQDNQGIESLLLADDRNPDDLDMFIISDVYRELDDHYQMPSAPNQRGPSIGTLSRIAWIVVGVCVASVFVVVYRGVTQMLDGTFDIVWGPVMHGVPLIMAALIIGALSFVRRLVFDTLIPAVPEASVDSWTYIRQMPVGQLWHMVELRWSSSLALGLSVVWKRLRNLGYRLVYMNERYEGKRVSLLLEHLSRDVSFADLPGVEPVSPLLFDVTDETRAMTTKMWFDNACQLPCAVVTGQATICYNLMKFIVRKHGDEPARYPSEVMAMWNALTDDWARFRDEPYALLQHRLPGVTLSRPSNRSVSSD